MCASDEIVALAAVDDHALYGAYFLFAFLGGNLLLYAHQFVQALLFHCLGYIVLVMVGGVGALLFGVCERSHAVEALLLYPGFECLKILFCLSRVSDHQCGAECYARHLAAYAVEQCVLFGSGYMPAHEAEHAVGAVLQGDVEVLADVRMLCHHGQYVVRKVRRVGVMEAYPLHALYLSHLVDQLRQPVLVVDIQAVR